MTQSPTEPAQQPTLETLLLRFDENLDQMATARPFARINHIGQVLDLARRILARPGGPKALYSRAARLDPAGVFEGSDWQHPETLKAQLAPHTFNSGDVRLVAQECLSELRLLAIAKGQYFHPGLSSEQAAHFLTQVLAFNLQILFNLPDELSRTRPPAIQKMLQEVLTFIAGEIGYENILDQVVDEVWRLLRQRPLKVDSIKEMVTHIAVCLFDPEIQIHGARGAERLVSALYGPTQGCYEDPGLEVYVERLTGMDEFTLSQEAQGLARAMHDTGLVSPYHAVFMRQMLDQDPELLIKALGLSTTGRDCFYCYRDLVTHLIETCIHAETAQAVYGLAMMLERGILYHPSIAPSLWRQMHTPLHFEVQHSLQTVFGNRIASRDLLLAGTVSLLGQPLGVGQGDNPTCQSARAIALWAYSDPDLLLQLIRAAARDNQVIMLFEGQPLYSAQLSGGLVRQWNYDLDPVSLVLVPHLDRIYIEMGRRVADRGGDPHRWINPEFNGWRVFRGFAIAVDVASGHLTQLARFVRIFYTLYHPFYNGNTPLVHPQPAGVAVTDAQGHFIGWHAIAIMRVALDQEDTMRVYFYNPNNDSGQDWGQGVHVSTEGFGEFYGESSLPIADFASRLYIFHYDETDCKALADVDAEELERVCQQVYQSWGAQRLPEIP